MGGRLKPYIEKELDNYIEKNCQDMGSYHYKISDDSETFTLVAKMYTIDPDNVFDRVKIIGQIVNAQYFNLARVGECMVIIISCINLINKIRLGVLVVLDSLF